MSTSEASASGPGGELSGLFFSLIGGQVCACWHGRDDIIPLAPLVEAQIAMLDFQVQTKVAERLHRGLEG